MNLLVVSIYVLVLLNTCNHAFGQLLDCDCAPRIYTFDVYFQRGCDTLSLSGFDNDAIAETGVLCDVTGSDFLGSGGGYAYNATILNVGTMDATSFKISNASFDPGADSFEISFFGPFGGLAPVLKENYSSGLEVELNIFLSGGFNDVVRRMDVFIPYTGQCNQIVFSDEDSIAWLTFVSLTYALFNCVD
jgi:hypothetical protein